MMIIDIRKLNAQKQYAGELSFTYDAPETLIGIPLVSFVAPVKVELHYELYEDNSFEVFGKVSFELEGQCSRCLQPAKAQVEGEMQAYFEPRKDAEDYSYSNGMVDMRSALDDAIMACMPYVLSCKEDCEGLSYRDEQQ